MDSATFSRPDASGATALLLGAALAGFDAGAIGFVLPAVRTDLGADPQQAAWLVSLYATGTLVAIPAAGMALRRVGADLVFRTCACVAIAGALISTLSPGITQLLVGRLLQGIGQGPLLPVAAAIVAMRWPAARQGRLMGAISLAYGAAFLAGMTVTPVLLNTGWRTIFVLMATLAIGTLVMPVPRGSTAAAAPPVSVRGVQRNREIVAIALVALGTGVGQVVVVLFPTVAVQRLGVTASGAGGPTPPLAVAGICATLGVTALLDRVGAKGLLAAGGIATVAGVLLAAAAPASPATFLGGAAVLGLGISALSGGPLRYAAARAVSAAEQGPAQAGVALVTNVGVTAGSVMLGSLAARGASERAAIETAMLVACVLMAVLFLATLSLRTKAEA